jgi:hypothetical protein
MSLLNRRNNFSKPEEEMKAMIHYASSHQG